MSKRRIRALYASACAEAVKRARPGEAVEFYQMAVDRRNALKEALDAAEESFDLAEHLTDQREWSERTFGPGTRTEGVLDHIRKELSEIEADPLSLEEWIDVVILALDGAWRSGHSPEQIADALRAKHAKNKKRRWPDWRAAEPGKAIEHDRDGDG